MLWDALILLGGILIGILLDWFVTGLLLPFNKRNASIVLIGIVALLGLLVWNQPRDSISVSLPTNMPLASAMRLIAESRGAILDLDQNCESAMRGAVLLQGNMTAGNLKQLLELAQHRLAESGPQVRYSIVAFPEKSFYEVRC